MAVEKAIRITPDGAEVYAAGERVASISSSHTRLDSASVNLGPSDVGRIMSGAWQMNPVSAVLPSSIVTPNTTWLPYVGEVNILLNIVWVIRQYMEGLKDSSGRPRANRAIKIQQVVDFNAMLPESD